MTAVNSIFLSEIFPVTIWDIFEASFPLWHHGVRKVAYTLPPVTPKLLLCNFTKKNRALM